MENAQGEKNVRYIAPTISPKEQIASKYRQKRVVAYCRVSTKEEEQLNSYETQVAYYTEKIRSEPDWAFVGIYADKGITGTSVKKRDEFKKMIRLCKQGKVDMIIVKSISRFARNTLDCIQHTRMLKQLNVDVYFEEQGIHSIEPGSEFLITIHGSIAQSESENISANVKWGKNQKAKEGKVTFQYKNFLGYKKGVDGNPEIDEEEADIIRYIYKSFLEGDSLQTISENLEFKGFMTKKGNKKWNRECVKSILTNEKYIGDAIINKTYVSDCISKKVKKNNGERAKYYVENNHPGIIDRITFARVQEEIARRNSKTRIAPTDSSIKRCKYSSKYALSELLVCGDCKSPYRRVVWSHREKKKAMWRCSNRLSWGTKYCKESPAIEEIRLNDAIMDGIFTVAKQDINILDTLKNHIATGLNINIKEDGGLDIEIRLAKIESEFNQMIATVNADNAETFNEEKAKALLMEKEELKKQLSHAKENKIKTEKVQYRLDDIYDIVDGLKNHPIRFDDKIVRQLIECVIVETKEKIKIVFKSGLEIIKKF